MYEKLHCKLAGKQGGSQIGVGLTTDGLQVGFQ